jgi:VIT1/CCC1 family predicted Fe2+/Mn2+ transporter
MSDGLTVPFALAAGLTGIASARVIVTAGLAEIAAGAIAMGLGGYLAAKSDAEHYAKEREREKREVVEIPDEEKREVAQVFHSYGLSHEESEPIVEALARHPQKWVDFMMRFELGLEKPDPKRALVSAFTIAASYVAGGLIPLAPYIVADFEQMSIATALLLSVAVTLLALFVFGFIKGRYTGTRPLRSALQTALIGSLAAGAAFLIARLIS